MDFKGHPSSVPFLASWFLGEEMEAEGETGKHHSWFAFEP